MALDTVKITGTFNFPDATWTQFARAVFVISGYDTDTEIVTPSPVEVDLGPNGELDVDLWPNTSGLRGTVYRVYVDFYTDDSYSNLIKRVDFKRIQIDGPADIANLLDVPVSVPGFWYSAITQAEYDAAIQAAADAAASAAEAALYDGPWLDDVPALLADTSLTYTAGQPGSGEAGDIVRTRKEGFAYEWADSGASDHHVETAGGVKFYVLANAGIIFLEQFGLADGDDVTFALDTALAMRPAKIETKQALSLTTTGVNRDLRQSGVDHPALTVDLKGSVLTKIGSHTYAVIQTKGVVAFDVHAVTIDGDNLAAAGWYHISERDVFTGYVAFHNCHARNLLQVVSGGGGQGAGFRVSGAMARASMVGGSVSDVGADPSVGEKITRGFFASSNFGLLGQKNFPLLVECLGADIRRITPSDDADGVFASAEDTATGREKSRFVVRNCYFEDCAKRSIKSQYHLNDTQFNTFAHTVNAPEGPGREEVAFQRGGGACDNNTYRYAGTARFLFYDGRAATFSNGVTSFSNNDVSIGGGLISRFIVASEFLAGGDYSPGFVANNNTIVGGSAQSFVSLRPGSRSSGIVTTGPIQLRGNSFDGITSSLVLLNRGPSVSGDSNAFFARFEKLDVSGNINRGAAVPLVGFGSGDPTGSSITVLDEVFGENTGFQFQSLVNADLINGVIIQQKTEAFTFTGADPDFKVAQFSSLGSDRTRRGALFTGSCLFENHRDTFSSNFRSASVHFVGEVGVQSVTADDMNITGSVSVLASAADGVTVADVELEYSIDAGANWLPVVNTRSGSTEHAVGPVLFRIVVDLTASAPGSFGDDRRQWRVHTNLQASPFGGGRFDNIDVELLS